MEQWDIKKPRGNTLSDNIMDQLIELIAQGKLKPGDRLPAERELSEMFGVSRTSMREAIKSLSKVGLFRIMPGKGTYIECAQDVNVNALAYPLLLLENDIGFLYEAREVVQGEMARLAAERATKEDIEEIRLAIQRAKEAEGIIEQANVDVQFDLGVAKAAKNTILIKFLYSIQEFMRLTQMRFITSERYSNSIQDHTRILEFIEQGLSAEAGEAMRTHIQKVKKSIQSETVK
jgi:GntR family transcriptional regulator, transcriptional repressor for pyruvate dehydrogenase complex